MEQNGYIKLYRKILNWEWFDNSYMVHLYIELLLSANIQDRSWHGETIKRGQFLTSISHLKDETKIPASTIRRCLKKLVSTGEISIKTTNKFSIITICNYDSYQANEQVSGEQVANKWQADEQTSGEQVANKRFSNEQQLKNIKNDKNDKNGRKEETTNVVSLPKKSTLEERKKSFAEKLEPYLTKYGRDMLNDFYSYWTEHNDGGYKMRFEKERTFQVSRRLDTWKRNDLNSKHPKYGNMETSDTRLGYNERIVTREDGSQYRTYGDSGAVIPMEAAPRPSSDSQWDSENQRWFRC